MKNLTCLLLGAIATLCAHAAETPNVLIVTVDTLRADRLSSYGYERPTSPNVDRLMVGGLCRLATAAERPVLRRLASDRDAVARRLAVNALGRMGTADDRRLVARLARSDRDRGVRRQLDAEKQAVRTGGAFRALRRDPEPSSLVRADS